ncbi:MAG TPA: cell division protein ZapA [Sphingomonas sp.]|jgi:cell division protein ZapA|uniref:cell division protein ZapA n=1 Tax=Sphingomonas sp. TaxID=28214 RepID=UPI002ED9995F
MAQVTLSFGGRGHVVACRDGEEARVHQLGQIIEERWAGAARAGGGSYERTFLYVALMLADALDEAENRPLPDNLVSEDELAGIADRLESLAATLEQTTPTS